MTNLERIENQLHNAGVLCSTASFKRFPVKALWVDDRIFISPDVKNSTEKRCILVEEYCHHKYSAGNALRDAKQEAFARKKSYEMLVPLPALRAAEKAGFCTVQEVAEYLDVTEEILLLALEHYKSKGLV